MINDNEQIAKEKKKKEKKCRKRIKMVKNIVAQKLKEN